jgi:hypothetical protein
MSAGRKYNRDKSREFRERQRARREGKTDELAVKRAKRTDSRESVARRRTPGEMERAVVQECEGIPDAKPTLVVAAKNLGRIVDDLAGNPKATALYNSTMKQLMATMAELRGDETDKRKTGKRKSGGRLATVGALTKVKRAQ